jgi:hypothetical protein
MPACILQALQAAPAFAWDPLMVRIAASRSQESSRIAKRQLKSHPIQSWLDAIGTIREQ